MKKLYLIVLLLFILSCSEKIPRDLNGEWVIDEIQYLNSSVYPETISSNIEISFNVVGYEDAEKIKFINSHSAVILPGFKSERIRVDFIKNGRIIEFKEHNGLNYTDKSYDLTKRIFLHKYEILVGDEKGQLILKSDSTSLTILNQNVLIENRTNNLFNG
tara:strand:+ start:1974 stop:2453 length:480 start_codon:yes stop_codon:yes gene_type:complete